MSDEEISVSYTDVKDLLGARTDIDCRDILVSILYFCDSADSYGDDIESDDIRRLVREGLESSDA